MLLNDVVLGKTVKLKVSDPTLNQPPNGYNSVIGEPGGDLNYDESIGEELFSVLLTLAMELMPSMGLQSTRMMLFDLCS
ncbi:hypothetical protein PHLCEN_2v6876 [Hermanssonia centrifuga]|uniref:Uncharacterized protein n=1 Tax=Hermanssonia centrifuga TaxID=98765 RepID=A0A2R6NY71_9APHY|nr:hypothetical protein PHLCEN_2v6876 [Hermanssonia centrifuga]